MNTGPGRDLAFSDLARQGARVDRQLPVTALPRLAALLEDVSVEALAELRFHLDDDGFPWVDGRASLHGLLTCSRCAETLEHRLEASFTLCIVGDEAVASRLADDRDVLVAESPLLSVAEIVEDELLLALPERLCREDPCARRPALEYPAPGFVAEGDAGEPGPFAALAELKGSREDAADE